MKQVCVKKIFRTPYQCTDCINRRSTSTTIHKISSHKSKPSKTEQNQQPTTSNTQRRNRSATRRICRHFFAIDMSFESLRALTF